MMAIHGVFGAMGGWGDADVTVLEKSEDGHGKWGD